LSAHRDPRQAQRELNGIHYFLWQNRIIDHGPPGREDGGAIERCV
jgi:hypothetical protein